VEHLGDLLHIVIGTEVTIDNLAPCSVFDPQANVKGIVDGDGRL